MPLSAKKQRQVQDPVKARFMSQFYDLASVHDYQRQGASLVLTQHLRQAQADHSETPAEGESPFGAGCCPDLNYTMKRLVRGLPSSREGARQGFALAMTEVRSETLGCSSAPFDRR